MLLLLIHIQNKLPISITKCGNAKGLGPKAGPMTHTQEYNTYVGREERKQLTKAGGRRQSSPLSSSSFPFELFELLRRRLPMNLIAREMEPLCQKLLLLRLWMKKSLLFLSPEQQPQFNDASVFFFRILLPPSLHTACKTSFYFDGERRGRGRKGDL